LVEVSPDPFARALREFGPAGVAAMVVVAVGALIGPVVAAALVLIWAIRSRTPWSELGLARPRSWPATLAIGVLSGIALKLVMKAIVMPLLGAPVLNERYQFLVGNRGAIPGMTFTILVSAGFGEELFYRGYLFERSGKRFGTGPAARGATVALTTFVFAAAHYGDQGLPGVQQALLTGAAFGTAFAVTGRLWPIIVAHAAFDLAAYALIYWRLEAVVGRLIFR
jgi:membrane protease YdiL (CAAX protease family)